MALELRLLGPFTAVYNGQPLDTFRSNKTQALLAYLVTEAAFAEEGRPPTHQREHLMALLWPRTPQKSAQVNLRQTLYQLRRAVPEVAGPGNESVSFILSDRQTVQINPDADYRQDVARFLLSGALLAGDPTPDELAEAVSLYRGALLSDFHLPDSETFEEWAAGRRATLQRMALEALETLTEHHLDRAEVAEAERYARRQIALDELRESGHRLLMRALTRQGRRNAAVAHYKEYRSLLEEELGLAPSAEIEALYDAVREGRAVIAAAPAARAKPQARQKPRLPSPATPFVGRQREMAEVTGMLNDGCRLLTLLGPGGSGKTRLGLEVARRRAAEYARGSAFVDLAPLSDPADIPTSIATALDFRFTDEGSARQQIVNYLANKELLLVLDNFEHLLEGAELVDDLLRAAPGVSLIATSRARLSLGAECLFEVDGLELNEAGSDALEMFMAYARRVQPGFVVNEAEKAVVARVCRLVEGMPLAIELAASWVRILAPEEIARELAEDVDFLASERADLPDRQRSMRAAFDHSWNLLDEGSRQALMKLSVFRGGAGRQAATAVTGASLRTLLALADHSLLTLDPDSGRFAVHELLRQFAEERLEEAGEADEVRDAHSAYYLQALAGRLPDLKGRDQLGALDAIEEDFENVRAAWQWAVRQGRWQHFPEASQSLYLFFLFRSRYQDGIELFEEASDALAAPTIVQERQIRACALACGQLFSRRLGLREETPAAVPTLREAVQELNDPATVAFCQLILGQILFYETDWGEDQSAAVEALEAARVFYQQANEPFYRAMTLSRLAVAYARALEQEEAVGLQRRALALALEAGDRFVTANLFHNLATAAWAAEGLTEAVETHYTEATNLYREIGARAAYAHSLAHLALAIIWRKGDLARSRPMLEQAHTIATEQNSSIFRRVTLNYLATLRLLEGNYEQVLSLTREVLAAGEKYGWEWGWATFQRGIAFLASDSVDNAIAYLKRALSWVMNVVQPSWMRTFLAYFCALLARQGEHEQAVELLALGLTDPFHRRALEIDPLLKRTRAELEEALGEEAFAAAWERGKELDPLAAAEEVLETLEQMETAG